MNVLGTLPMVTLERDRVFFIVKEVGTVQKRLRRSTNDR